MKKRIVAVILVFMMCFGVFSVTFADQIAAGESRVSIGADLTAEQRELLQAFERALLGEQGAEMAERHRPKERGWLDGVKRFWDDLRGE